MSLWQGRFFLYYDRFAFMPSLCIFSVYHCCPLRTKNGDLRMIRVKITMAADLILVGPDPEPAFEKYSDPDLLFYGQEV